MNTATVIKTQQIRFTKVKPAKGGKITRWNVDVDGTPFGQIWKHADTKTCFGNPYVVQLLDNREGSFDTYEAAERFVLDAAGE